MLSEFDFIQNIKNRYGLGHIGDDCAVLVNDGITDTVVTGDMLVEDIDFRLDWTTPELVGHKALAVSLSDVAAMGAQPKWALLAIGVPAHVWNSEFLDRFYSGWFRLAQKYGVDLVGGDVSRTPDKIVIDCTVVGSVAAGTAILRSGAKPGDAIFVSGSLGGAAGGLILLEKGTRLDTKDRRETQEILKRQLRPSPRLELANSLKASNLASSMIDISDGFSSDLHHICDASSVGAVIDNIPTDENLLAHFPIEQAVRMAFDGGEDFELLFTSRPELSSVIDAMGLTRVGTITDDIGSVEFIDGDYRTEIKPRGYRHF